MSQPKKEVAKLDSVVKRFGGVVAVRGMSFACAEAELIGLIGPNGSGKTTIINMMSGALRPNSGDIEIKGKVMSNASAHEFARLGVARTFQIPRLFNRMTVLQNLMVPGLSDLRSQRKQARREAFGLLEFLQMKHIAHLEARLLSGGQKKLLELGRALMLKPSLLLLDEPFAGVHLGLLEQIETHIRELNRQRYTIIVVDHDIDAVKNLVGRLIVMADGRKIADGVPDEVLSEPAVLDAYAGVGVAESD